MILLYAASDHLVAVTDGRTLRLDLTLDTLFTAEDPAALLRQRLTGAAPAVLPAQPRAPLQSQEVWAAGVTYFRSMTARKEESKDAGGGTFYDRVYHADRPELFFKSTPHRVAAPGEPVRIRGDSKWNVPEPELTLAITSRGRIFGCTIGNDMSSRDIEGENPLYLPQAKVYLGCCALGPGIVVRDPLPRETAIGLAIRRDGAEVFSGATSISQMKRTFDELAGWLMRENGFPAGCVLLTGTGLVPPNEFTLAHGDEVAITIASVGTLRNIVG